MKIVEAADSTAVVTASIEALRIVLPTKSTFTFEVSPHEIYLDMLRVPPNEMGKGYATKLFTEICAIADDAGMRCRLIADASGEFNEPDTDCLIRLYGRFGFRIVGQDEDTGGSPVMVRKPGASPVENAPYNPSDWD